MKKILLLFGAAIIAFSSAWAQTKTADAKKATAAVKIDGILDESDWTTASKYKIGKVYTGEVIDDSLDCSGFFQVLWADSGLFVAVSVTDDIKGLDLTGKYGPDWAQDLIEVYIDMNYLSLKDGKGIDDNAGHYASVDPSRDTTIISKSGIGYTYKHTGDNGNFIKEVYFPWAALKDANGGVFTPNSNISLGFDVCVADNDSSAADASRNYRNRIVWSNAGPNENYGNMDDAGRLSFSDAPAVDFAKNAYCVKASAKIKVDGVIDEAAWGKAAKYDVYKAFTGEVIDGPADCSAYFQTLWADSGLFVAVTVNDDVKGLNKTGFGPDWAQDLVEVYVDMNTWGYKDGKGVDDNAGHYASVDPSYDTTITSASGIIYTYKHTGVNANFVKEIFFPWTAIKDVNGSAYNPNSKLPIGFDVCVADNDTSYLSSTRNYRDRIVWSNIGPNENYGNMDDAGKLYFVGTVEPITAASEKATAAIKIDAVLDDADWKVAPKYSVGKVFNGETIKDPSDCSAFFQTVWADSGIFVAVTVKDDVKGLNKTGFGPDWAQDLVEVYFDMNVNNLKDSLGVAGNKGHYASVDASYDTVRTVGGITYAYKHSTKGNYIKEVFAPWKVLKDANNGLYTSGKAIGFDVCIADNDTSYLSAGRNYRDRLVWSNNGDVMENYQNMNDAGRLKISGIPDIQSKVNATKIESELSIFPNPATNNIIVKAKNAEKLSVSISNITGQIIQTSTIENNSTLNISNLKNGIYFVKVSSGNQTQTTKLIKK